MKPANFSGNKNKRRIKSLDRLNFKKEKTDKDKKDIEILEKRIMAPQDAKNIRSKKTRSKK